MLRPTVIGRHERSSFLASSWDRRNFAGFSGQRHDQSSESSVPIAYQVSMRLDVVNADNMEQLVARRR